MGKRLFLLVLMLHIVWLSYLFVQSINKPLTSGKVVSKEHVEVKKDRRLPSPYWLTGDKWVITVESSGVLFEVVVKESEYKELKEGYTYKEGYSFP